MNQYLQLALFSVSLGIVAAQSQACFDKSQVAPLSSEDLSAGSTDFAFDLFKNVLINPNSPNRTGSHDTVFISPISVWSALTMTYLGCGGNTQEELAAALNISGHDPAVVTDSYRHLKDVDLSHTSTPSSNYTFRLANRLYFEKTLPIRLTCINHQLSNEIEKVDFVNAPQPSRIQINDWVANQTNDKIKDLLPADHVTSLTSMVIVNAAYFIGSWEKQFVESRTQAEQDFFSEPDRPIKVKMMNKDSQYLLKPSSSELGCSAIELPYSGGDVSMLVVLPDVGAKISDVAAKFSPTFISDIRKDMRLTDVQLSLPKFKVQQTLELKEHLQQMGVKDLFDSSAANMTGFTDASGNSVSYVRHKTYLDVNEGGTEAAAATAVGVTRLSAIIKPDQVKFVVNRPFLVFICNKKLNTVLFMGYIREPSQN